MDEKATPDTGQYAARLGFDSRNPSSGFEESIEMGTVREGKYKVLLFLPMFRSR